MKRTILALPPLVAAAGITGAQEAEAGRVFELRTYYAAPGKLDALHRRFREHTLALFAKHGMELVAFFSPTDEPDRDNALVYVLAHKSRAAAQASWKAFFGRIPTGSGAQRIREERADSREDRERLPRRRTGLLAVQVADQGSFSEGTQRPRGSKTESVSAPNWFLSTSWGWLARAARRSARNR